MILYSLIVLRQLVILLLIAAGSGYWLWLLGGARRWQRPHNYLWFFLAGFCVHALLLQSLVYVGLPLRFTAWPAFAICLAGVVLAQRRKMGRLFFSKEAQLYAVVFVAVFFGQAPGLLTQGPARYFGSGQYDHAHYVVTAEFLRNESFATRPEELGYRPWLHKALEIKEGRITQCVALGALAEVERSSAQEAYGSLSIFFVALAGVATAAWMRTAGFSRPVAGWAGLAAALTPALTRIQLDAFFSQTATLFIYPALAGVLGDRGRLTRAAKLCASALLAFFIGSYSEVAVFGVVFTSAMTLSQDRPWRTRIFDLATISAGALLLNVGFLSRLTVFLVDQFTFALNPDGLGTLFPESGTMLGWGRLFVDLPWTGAVMVAGLAVCGFGLASAKGVAPGRKRWRWLALLAVTVVPLLLLRAVPHFPRYPFAKLTAHFVPIWIGATAAGIVAIVGVLRNRRRKSYLLWTGGIATIAVIGATSWPRHAQVIRPVGRLATLSSDGLLELRRDAEIHPERTYLVENPDPLLALWLCYFGRKSPTVLERRALGDRLVPTETYAFRRWSPSLGPPWRLDPRHQGLVPDYEPPPRLEVRGAARAEVSQLEKSYIVTDAVDLVFTRPSEGKLRLVWLDFLAVPTQPGRPVEIVLENYEHAAQRVVLQSMGQLRWLVPLPPGETSCRLRVTAPADSDGGRRSVLLTMLSVEVALELGPGDPEPIGGVRAR